MYPHFVYSSFTRIYTYFAPDSTVMRRILSGRGLTGIELLDFPVKFG